MFNFTEVILFILRISPFTIYQITIASIMITGEFKYWIFAAGLIVSELSNHLFKYLIKKERPSPNGEEKGICTGCGVIPQHNKISTSYGMPSGHAQLLGYVAMFWTLYLFRNEIGNVDRYFPALLSIFILWCFSLLVCWSRVYNKCHSLKQVFVGLIIGSIIGTITYNNGSVYYPNILK